MVFETEIWEKAPEHCTGTFRKKEKEKRSESNHIRSNSIQKIIVNYKKYIITVN